jgi:hypothetical protein
MASCQYHPDRAGVGLCMRCRAVICAACCTRVDGVNHCHACLDALARRSTPPSRRAVGGVVPALLCVLCWGVLAAALGLVQGWLAP